MVVISDGDIIANETFNGEPLPLNVDKWTGQPYGNIDLLLNTVQYLLDDSGIIHLRSKNLQIQFLNKEKVFQEKTYWQIINIVLPLALLVMFGFSFYVGMQKRYIENEQEKILQLKALQITQKASYLPELQCSFNNIATDNCFDVEKLIAFNGMIESDPDRIGFYYYDLFGFSNIVIRPVYPAYAPLSLYSWPLPEGEYSMKKFVKVPVSIYFAETQNYGFAVMEIEVFEK